GGSAEISAEPAEFRGGPADLSCIGWDPSGARVGGGPDAGDGCGSCRGAPAPGSGVSDAGRFGLPAASPGDECGDRMELPSVFGERADAVPTSVGVCGRL